MNVSKNPGCNSCKKWSNFSAEVFAGEVKNGRHTLVTGCALQTLKAMCLPLLLDNYFTLKLEIALKTNSETLKAQNLKIKFYRSQVEFLKP